MVTRPRDRGQSLVLFALFLTVLLGVSALGVDYATWLLTDRRLQNIADSAAVAGGAEFGERIAQGTCASGPGAAKCLSARTQAWTSLNQQLELGMSAARIDCMASADSPSAGELDSSRCGGTETFRGYRLWVSTPPPASGEYTGGGIGGRYPRNFGVIFVRADLPVQSFLGRVFSANPIPRIGWATAGAIPTDFALQLFCRNNIAPENGVCVNSAGLTIDGQGGIRLLKGDIGSNESLTVTANTGSGVILDSGNMFLVNRDCGPSTWNCAEIPANTGGIADDDPNAVPNTANGKSAFYIAPLPVPQFQNPVTGTISAYDCSGATAATLCVPYKSQTNATPSAPGDWTCVTSGAGTLCGDPDIDTSGSSSTVTCEARSSGSASPHLLPDGVESGANTIVGDPGHPQNNGNEYRNVDDDPELNDPDTLDPPLGTVVDYVHTDNLNHTGGGTSTVSTAFTMTLRPPNGTPDPGPTTIRYVAFKTNAGVMTASGYPVTLLVALQEGGTTIATDSMRTLDGTPQLYEFDVPDAQISDFGDLSLRFTFTSANQVNNNANERGGAISWMEAETQDLEVVPPTIPPGYYRSIIIPDDGCAILDPTGYYSELEPYQMPGIYRFGGSGSNNNKKIKLGDGSFLIGDGVTLVFDPDWPDSGANQGVAIGADGALVLNTTQRPGTPPCMDPAQSESGPFDNWSAPLSDLPYSSLCAAWAIDPTDTIGIRPGANAWPYCDPANASSAQCVERSAYDPVAGYRGITFYFTPSGWPPSSITNRFEMQGGSGDEAGLSFRGVMYAPYDDVRITGGNGFNTVGQVQAWTAKFNGGSAYINLDYPYEFQVGPPYLLEPTIRR